MKKLTGFNQTTYWLIIITLLGFTLRLRAAANYNITPDELDSIWLAKHSIKGFIPFFTSNEVQAPFYNIILHFWLLVSENEIWARVLSVIAGTMVIIISFLIGKNILNEKLAISSSLLCALSPVLTYHSVLIRYNATALLFSSLSILFFIKILKNPKNNFYDCFGYILGNILLIYSFYFGVLLLLAEAAILLIIMARHNFKQWLVCHLTITIFFIPWLPCFLKQAELARGGGWEAIPVFSILSVMKDFSEGVTGIDPSYSFHRILSKFFGVQTGMQRWGVLITIIYFLFGIKSIKNHTMHGSKTSNYLPVWIFPFLILFVITAADILHYTSKMFFSWRYFHFLSLITTFILAGALYGNNNKKIVATFLRVSLAILFLLANQGVFPNWYKHSDKWNELVSYINMQKTGNSCVLYHWKRTEPLTTYYKMKEISVFALPENIPGYKTSQQSLFPPIHLENKDNFLKLMINYDRIFVIWGYGLRPFKDMGVELIKKWLTESGYSLVTQMNFGTILEIYEHPNEYKSRNK